LKFLLGIYKKQYTNPADRELVDSIRVSGKFDNVELEIEETELKGELLTETRKFLIGITKSRNIEETPSALSIAIGQVADSILKKASLVKTWSDGSSLPLSKAFIDGDEAWNKINTLINPNYRVREVHTARTDLEIGHKAIEAHAEFQAQCSTQFIELVKFSNKIEAIESIVKPTGRIKAFLEMYRAMKKDTSFTDKEDWKRIQTLKAEAELELTEYLNNWRTEARQLLDSIMSILPGELSQKGLDKSLLTEFEKPLIELRESIDKESLPAKVAGLKSLAALRISDISNRIFQEVEKKKKRQDKQKAPEREVKKVKPTEVAMVTRVRTEPEWDDLRDKLDRHVKKLLSEGFDVELE